MSIRIENFKFIGSEPDITKCTQVSEWAAGSYFITYAQFTPALSERLSSIPTESFEYPHMLYVIDKSIGQNGAPYLILTHEVMKGWDNVYFGIFDGSGIHKNLREVNPETTREEFLREAFAYLGDQIDISDIKLISSNDRSARPEIRNGITVRQRTVDAQSNSVSGGVVNEYEKLLVQITERKRSLLSSFLTLKDFNFWAAGIIGFGAAMLLEEIVAGYNRDLGYNAEEISRYLNAYLPSVIIGLLAGYAFTFYHRVRPDLAKRVKEIDRLKARVKSIETFRR